MSRKGFLMLIIILYCTNFTMLATVFALGFLFDYVMEKDVNK